MMRITPGRPLPTQPDEALRAISHNNRECKMIIVSNQAATAIKVTIGSYSDDPLMQRDETTLLL